MRKLLRDALLAAALALGTSITPAQAQHSHQQEAEIGFVKIDRDITLRRMVVRSPKPKGVILLLHGFPETLYAWQEVSRSLAGEFEVHAFDWPGFGLSSRPAVDKFTYAPKDYARVLKGYIKKAGIDGSKLTIYATDIGALPALLLALEDPGIAKRIIVGDFAPFNRPQYMAERLQNLKSAPTAEQVRTQLNAGRDEIIKNTWKRGLLPEAQFEVSPAFKSDMTFAWNRGAMTSADAFYHYYSHFTEDQAYFEANIGRLNTPVKVVWGEKDIYISKEMGLEFAKRTDTRFSLLLGIGHYPHLQNPKLIAEEIRATFP
jgi:pimeloyl-ACP methyl ester carboxylesterase